MPAFRPFAIPRAHGSSYKEVIPPGHHAPLDRMLETHVTDVMWQAVGEGIPDILMKLDADGTILFLNRSAGSTPPNELVGSNLFDYIPAVSHARVWMAMQDVFKRGEIRSLELTLTGRDGRVRWLQASGGPFRNGDQVVAATVLARDITTSKSTEFALSQLERQIQQLQKLDSLGHITGGIAHDFSNILVVIRASVELLLPVLPAGSNEHEGALAIWNAAERGAELTRRLMAFARSGEAGREMLDINPVVDHVCHLLDRLLRTGITIQKRLHPEPVQVLAERGQLDSVLTNLVLNARDAIARGGLITVATRVDAARGEAVLSVIDTGVGMDEPTQRRIFEPFFTTKPEGRGTGLGLSTVAMVVELLGGRIAVKSKVSVGTTIDVILPRAIPEGVDG